ncbi:PDZ domain-containing protein [Campylobacter hepaticus]|uniref:PDZ domain-containing protein n=1 Tax=Campylobacter hepaticus TaxID=1813019 RepID=A0A424Z1P2_9BACT|nr:PDZ domain-containing protein [Campylobacter hepaticus]AXP09536.1 PDZ domain-containing protein [Campylobacter hepaticus]MCZ0772954.1 PDZ domain-containing protein [Campylobacter hepaticus]MCZ0772970.1 PDZ domain-containing protein [Campylobacter hepaticus]MCZ0774423.1 PDZ domain-containing protein [Campylobacter hepaticus]MCZ0775675.1 PDZ domain-containing protein [Campylobacter hepaticus]
MKKILVFCTLFGLCFSIERPKFEDFIAGYERNKASMLTYEGMPAFALSENLLAVLKQSNTKLNKYVKYDPFLNLYLVRTDFSLFPASMGDEEKLTRNDWVGIWNINEPYIGHIKYLAQDINEKDQLDFNSKIGLLGTPCCEMMGIALNNSSFIGNRYLKHFMKYNDVYWGDIGVDFVMRENKIYVNKVRKNPQFLINDQIISVDGVAVNNLRKLNEKILFADRGSTLYFKVLRDNQDLNISTEIFAKDLSKFNILNTKPKSKITNFRSNLGLTINNSSIITKIDPNSKAQKAGFMVGDKILRVNNIIFNNSKELQDILTTGNDFNILIERKSNKLPLSNFDNIADTSFGGDGKFQFFIRLIK